MRKAFLRYLIYGLLMATTAYGIMLVPYILPGGLSLDIAVQRAATSEFSAIEQLQHACLLICVGLFIWIASRDRLRRPMAIAWASLFALFLIRELDYVFDTYVVENFWQVLCAVLLAISGVYLVRNRNRFLNGWRRSWPSAGLGMVFGGLLMLVPFTQIVASNQLWSVVMDEHYVRAAKIAAEELMELGAYLVMLIGSIEFLYSWSRLPQTKLIGALSKRRPRRKARNKKRSV
ncbi:MAG: hypothetical protein ACI80M_001080 [Gammaproteobacteria bacterium]|jgi:hypothetical protein|tara:strand:+ start:424 stop:1122 length:699 start_codon:yes stop_codon:yes gene_type:complete